MHIRTFSQLFILCKFEWGGAETNRTFSNTFGKVLLIYATTLIHYVVHGLD